MNWDIQHIFLNLPILGDTILSVFLSPEFRIILYFVIAVILVVGTLYFKAKKYILPDAFRKAIIAAFFISGILYAIYADRGWTQWLMTDARNYWGLSTEEKLRKNDSILYDFATQAKQIIDEDYQIYTSFYYAEQRMQYFLLPLHKRKQARYIIVIADDYALFDQRTHIFTRGETVIANAEPVIVFDPDLYMLRRP